MLPLTSPPFHRSAGRRSRWETKEAPAPGDSAPPGQRDEVEAIGQACELFCDADGDAYASVTVAGHRETWPVSSSRFRRYVLREYRHRHGRLAAGTALSEGIEAIAATACAGPRRARYSSASARPLTRSTSTFAATIGRWSKWTSAGGDASPVPFLRPAGLRPLPLPCRSELGINRLRPLVNIPDDREWMLYVLTIVGWFRPTGPYPVLIVNGEQGSGKIGTVRKARRLGDPAKVELAKTPRSEDDLIIAAKSQ